MKYDSSRKIKIRAIIEIAGKPKEYIENAIKLLVDKLKTEKDIIVLENEIFDAKKLVDEGSIYTIFAELVIDLKDVLSLSKFCFDYTPSSVEILEPEQLKLDAPSATSFINDLLSRLHETDMVLKNIRAEHQVLNINATTLLKNFIMISLRDKERTLQEISDYIGISQDQLKPFINSMLDSNIISEVNDKYRLIR